MTGETDTDEKSLVDVEVGTTVYDDDGNALGVIRGVDDAGFYVRSEEGTVRVPLDDARAVSGRTYVMWRCWVWGDGPHRGGAARGVSPL